MSDYNGTKSVPRKPSLKELESEVERNRQRFGDSVLSLRDKVEDISDWRHWVRSAPWKSMLGCVVVGWALGRLVSKE